MHVCMITFYSLYAIWYKNHSTPLTEWGTDPEYFSVEPRARMLKHTQIKNKQTNKQRKYMTTTYPRYQMGSTLPISRKVNIVNGGLREASAYEERSGRGACWVHGLVRGFVDIYRLSSCCCTNVQTLYFSSRPL